MGGGLDHVGRLAAPATRNHKTSEARARAIRNRAATSRVLEAMFLTIPQFNAAVAAAPLLCEREMTRAARQNEIPLNILYSVALTETGHKRALSPA